MLDDRKEIMAATKRPTYAVCPRIERNGDIPSPKLFKSELSAKRFLNSEVRFPLEPEAEVTGLTVEEVRARRATRKAQVNRERKEAANRIKIGDLHPSAYPPQLQPILNCNQGWQDPVPVCRAADYSGPACNRSVRQFVPVDAIGVMPPFNLKEEIGRALEGRSADYTCYLDQDWWFDEIEADAERRSGHEFGGRQHRNIAEIVVKAIHDVEAAFLRVHPKASCQAIADFWRSWQLQRHVAEFCGRVADSEAARSLAGTAFDAADETERTRLHMYR